MNTATKTRKKGNPSCPCGSGLLFDKCCGLWNADNPPLDAVALMRSRYSAYVLNNSAWLLTTWHSSTRPDSLDLTPEPQPKWLGLDILRQQDTGPDYAVVEFIARYRLGGRAHRLHETSRFVREQGHWFYLDGSFAE